ncbi:MAG TPA: GNAT family N-acetyltransferase [Candidatus Udaeobacter sp.]|nr:GNAT family N-acetyltransferase [Candidatus Udaeobacter sp.]
MFEAGRRFIFGPMLESVLVEELAPGDLDSAIPSLSLVLAACVAKGASIGFLPPFDAGEAAEFWRKMAVQICAGERRLLAARRGGQGGKILGAVMVVLAMPANGRHRAEISKLIVDPESRRLGIGRALMTAAEALARREGRTLLVLDTRTDDAAETLYASLGFRKTGVIPDYVRSETGALDSTTVMFKLLT